MKLDINKKARDFVKAVGAGGILKKDNCALLKLSEVDKLEAHSTSPLSDKFSICQSSLRDNNDQLTDA